VVKYFTGFPFSPSVLQNGRRCPKGGGGHAVKASARTLRIIWIPASARMTDSLPFAPLRLSERLLSPGYSQYHVQRVVKPVKFRLLQVAKHIPAD